MDIDNLPSTLAAIQRVSVEDLQRTLKKYVAHIADPKRADVAVTTNPAKSADIAAKFESLGYKFQVVSEEELPSHFKFA